MSVQMLPHSRVVPEHLCAALKNNSETQLACKLVLTLVPCSHVLSVQRLSFQSHFPFVFQKKAKGFWGRGVNGCCSPQHWVGRFVIFGPQKSALMFSLLLLGWAMPRGHGAVLCCVWHIRATDVRVWGEGTEVGMLCLSSGRGSQRRPFPASGSTLDSWDTHNLARTLLAAVGLWGKPWPWGWGQLRAAGWVGFWPSHADLSAWQVRWREQYAPDYEYLRRLFMWIRSYEVGWWPLVAEAHMIWCEWKDTQLNAIIWKLIDIYYYKLVS